MNEIDRMRAIAERSLRQPQVLIFVIAAAVVTLLISSTAGWWFLLVVLGFAVLALYLAAQSSKTGPTATAGTPSGIPGPRFDLSRLEGNYRQDMERALNTQGSIQRAIAECSDPGLRRALTDATGETEELLATIYDLALKAQSVNSALTSSGDMARLSQEIQQLDANIKGTNDEFQKSQYYAALDAKLQQMQNYTDTTVALKRWDAQLDNALSTLDTILSQVLRIRSSEVLQRTDATDQVSQSLREQVESLKAASDAFDAVYGNKV